MADELHRKLDEIITRYKAIAFSAADISRSRGKISSLLFDVSKVPDHQINRFLNELHALRSLLIKHFPEERDIHPYTSVLWRPPKIGLHNPYYPSKALTEIRDAIVRKKNAYATATISGLLSGRGITKDTASLISTHLFFSDIKSITGVCTKTRAAGREELRMVTPGVLNLS